MEYNFFDKISSASGVAALPNKYMPNYQLANKFHRQVIRTFKRRKVYSSFKDNIWSVDLADMKSLKNFSKYAWVVPLKDKRAITLVSSLQKILNSSKSSKAKFKRR